MVEMDIEGAEALAGAKHLVKSSQPVWAMCLS